MFRLIGSTTKIAFSCAELRQASTPSRSPAASPQCQGIPQQSFRAPGRRATSARSSPTPDGKHHKTSTRSKAVRMEMERDVLAPRSLNGARMQRTLLRKRLKARLQTLYPVLVRSSFCHGYLASTAQVRIPLCFKIRNALQHLMPPPPAPTPV